MKNIYFLTLLLSLLGCSDSNAKMNDDLVFQCLIAPTGIIEKSYSIKLYVDGLMISEYGERKDLVGGVVLGKVFESKKKVFSMTEIKEIKNLISQIRTQDKTKNRIIYKGGWEMMLDFGGEKFQFNVPDIDSGDGKLPIAELLKWILLNSPLKISIESLS